VPPLDELPPEPEPEPELGPEPEPEPEDAEPPVADAPLLEEPLVYEPLVPPVECPRAPVLPLLLLDDAWPPVDPLLEPTPDVVQAASAETSKPSIVSHRIGTSSTRI
jgi:hypothetical protein